MIHPIADCEDPLLCLLGPSIVSQETAISGSFMKFLLVYAMCQQFEADYGVDPWIWQSLDGPSVCCKDRDIAVSFETRLGPSKHRSGCSQSTIGWITGPPMEEVGKVSKELKGSATL